MGKVVQMPHIVNTSRMHEDECVVIQPEPAHAACEDYETKALTVSRWMRVKRALRAWSIRRLWPARGK